MQQVLPTAGSALGQAQSNQAPGRSDLEEPLQRVNEVINGSGVPFEISDPPGERLVTRIVGIASAAVGITGNLLQFAVERTSDQLVLASALLEVDAFGAKTCGITNRSRCRIAQRRGRT